MKKTYQTPIMKTVKVQLTKMIAASDPQAVMYGKDATGDGLSREGGSFWDDDEE
ncbi:MAG: hypothetical protein IJ533_07270 [Prevotella sp.]|nr:hypothetical protein [Prevotella sp.]